MAHDLLKILVALFVLGVVVAVMALFVSGYLSAFKSGDKSKQGPMAAISGARNVGSRPVPSPSPGVNQTMRAYQQYARGMPQGPMPPEVQMPPGLTGMGMQPPTMGPSIATVPPLRLPRVPAVPGISGIIDVLFRVLPLIFHHDFSLSPVWPRLNQ